MKVHEVAKIMGIKSRELISRLDCVDHHNDLVPEELIAELIGGANSEEESIDDAVLNSPDVVEEVKVVKAPAEKCEYALDQIELSIRCLGNKSPLWKYRNLLR